jgi:hypothetical protein
MRRFFTSAVKKLGCKARGILGKAPGLITIMRGSSSTPGSRPMVGEVFMLVGLAAFDGYVRSQGMAQE